jgi:hypothetical protein
MSLLQWLTLGGCVIVGGVIGYALCAALANAQRMAARLKDPNYLPDGWGRMIERIEDE